MNMRDLQAIQSKLKMFQDGRTVTEKMSDAECLKLYGISKEQVLKNISSTINETEKDLYRAEHPLSETDKMLALIAKGHFTAVAERGDLETHHNNHEDFFEVSVWDLKAALKEAHSAGCRKGGYDTEIHNMYDQVKALTNIIFHLSESGTWSECKVMEILLEIFDPIELEEMGFSERIKPYMDEYY